MPTSEMHNYYMECALEQADIALSKGEVPVGAVLVDGQGDIVCRDYNRVETLNCQTEHAELRVIKAATGLVKSWRLDDYSLYVTLEPCLMCLGLINLSRISKVFYGATSPLFGACGIRDRFPALFQKKTVIVEGLKEADCVDRMKKFFRQARDRRHYETEANIFRGHKKTSS